MKNEWATILSEYLKQAKYNNIHLVGNISNATLYLTSPQQVHSYIIQQDTLVSQYSITLPHPIQCSTTLSSNVILYSSKNTISLYTPTLSLEHTTQHNTADREITTTEVVGNGDDGFILLSHNGLLSQYKLGIKSGFTIWFQVQLEVRIKAFDCFSSLLVLHTYESMHVMLLQV